MNTRRGPRRSETLALAGLALASSILASLVVASDVRAQDAVRPEIVALELDLRLDPERGLVTLDADVGVVGAGVVSIPFDLGDGMVVERVRAARGVAEASRRPGGVAVFVDPPLEDGTPRTLRFRITGRPRRGADDLVRSDFAVLGGSDGWYPTLERVRAPVRLTVEAPEGWDTLGPGSPGEARVDAGRVTRTWVSAEPLRSVALAAAPGLALGTGRIAGETLRVAKDADDEDALAAAYRDVFGDPMAWFSAALRPYPYDGFNVAVLPDAPHDAIGSGVFVAGAEFPLEGRADGAAALAPQWYGQIVAADGRWFEAFGAWHAVVYARDRSIPMAEAIADARRRFFGLDPVTDVPLVRADADTSDAVVRGKGSAAPDAVRRMVGDREMFRAIGDLFEADWTRPVRLPDVVALVEARTSAPIADVFAQWFEREGAPRLEVVVRVIEAPSDGHRVDVELRQLGSTYRFPIDVRLVGVDRREERTVELADEVTRVYWILPFEPGRVEIDPLGEVFQYPPRITGPARP